MKYLFYFFIFLLLHSCNKNEVLLTHPEFEGNWHHYTDVKDYHYLTIKSNSRGYKMFYKNNDFESDTQERIWRIKNETLIFSRMKSKIDSYSINTYPTISTTNFVDGFDTIVIGQKYMKLNNKIYAGSK